MCSKEFLAQEQREIVGERVRNHVAESMQDRLQTLEKRATPLYIHCTKGMVHIWCGEPKQIQLGTILTGILE